MEKKSVLPLKNRVQFRQWLSENSESEKECWLFLKRGRPVDDMHFWYLDAVEEALCFGWIDGQVGKVDGIYVQRFSPRSAKGLWTELNKERCRRLIRLDLMTERGMRVLPDLDAPFTIDTDIKDALMGSGAWNNFTKFPELYQRVRSYNVASRKKRDKASYDRALCHLIDASLAGEMFGEWNDYGRLL